MFRIQCWSWSLILPAAAFVSPPCYPSFVDRRVQPYLYRTKAAPKHIVLQADYSSQNNNNNNNDDDEEEEDPEICFNDFDFIIGDVSAPEAAGAAAAQFSSQGILNDRIQETQQQEMYRDTRLLQNWKHGDWSVRGFSLDSNDAMDDFFANNNKQNDNMKNSNGGININLESNPAAAAGSIYVSKVVPDTNSNGKRVWVGRSNGSLVWVQLGTEYTTHFRSKIGDQLSQNNGNDSNNGNTDQDASSSTSVPVGSELIREESNPLIPNEKGYVPAQDPFSILAQYSPSNDAGGAVSHILSVPDEDCIFTTCEGSNQIQQWHIHDDDIIKRTSALQTTPVPLSEEIHNSPIVALKLAHYREAPLLLSVGADGSIALWDMQKADLVYHCQLCLEEITEMVVNVVPVATPSTSTPFVHCADVNDSHIYLGTTTGLVLAYDVKDLVESRTYGENCPLPRGKFMAHEGGVTAIACGGPGSLGRAGGGGGSGGGTKSSVLFTGGQNGVVKQWEMLSNPSLQKLENWPKIPSQRLPKKAHLFEGHYGPITAIQSLGGKRPQFLTASKDGTIRTWDVAKGKEEYRMDGFTEDLSSLCLQGCSDTEDDMLITNGMKQYVCIHDFSQGISGESIDNFFDQWDDC